MTRRDLMALSALVLLLVVCGWTTGIGPTVSAQQIDTPTPACIQLEQTSATGGTWEQIPCSSVPTPVPTDTPTQTPTATATSTPAATPTQETLFSCDLLNESDSAIRLRTSPDTDTLENVVGSIAVGGTVTAEGFLPPQFDGDFLWYLIWRSDLNRYVWTADLYTERGDCSMLPVRRMSSPGIHAVIGTQEEVAVKSVQLWNTFKGTDGTENLVHLVYATNPDALVVWRDWGIGDGFPGYGEADPLTAANARWAAVKLMLKLRGLWQYAVNPDYWFYVEYLNEQRHIPGWSGPFHLQMAKNAAADGVCLALFSPGYGSPEPEEYAEFAEAIEWSLDNPCQPGKTHIAALHGYAAWDAGPWTFGRWMMMTAAVAEIIGHRAWLMPIYYSEYGMPPYYDGRHDIDCALSAEAMKIVGGIYRTRPEIWGYAVFSTGPVEGWSDFSDCVRQL